VSTLKEIESAIIALSPHERLQLVSDLPRLIPECEADLAWQRIVSNPTPNVRLSKLVDSIDAEMKRNPESFKQIHDDDFRHNS